METLLPLLFVAIIVGVLIYKNKPEWVEKIKSWIK